MVGDSKILTVSYGTFSCTLEGFDDPFSTMKAIAEYFRDLAADDRYFGAEPPTPDAQMLHQIAEREVQRRVEAKIQENGVVLKAGADSTAAAPLAAAALAAPAAAATPVAEETDSQPEVAPAADAAPEAAHTPEPAPAPEIETPLEPDSVAAKLLRIRAAVAQARESGIPAAASVATPVPVQPETGLRPHLADPEDSDFEAESPEAVLPAATIPAVAFAAPEEPAEEASPDAGETPAEDAAIEETLAQGAPAEDATEAASEDTSVEEAQAETSEEPSEEAQAEDAQSLANIMAATAAAQAAPAEAPEADVEADAEMGAETDAEDIAAEDGTPAETAPEETAAEDHGALEDTVGSFLSSLGADTVEEDSADGESAPEAAAGEGTAEVAEDTAAEPAEEAPVAEETAETHAEAAAEEAAEEAEDEPAPALAPSLLARARARVIKVRRIESGAPEILREEDEAAQEPLAETSQPEETATETPAAAPVAEETAEDAVVETPAEDATLEEAAAEETPAAEGQADDAQAAEDHVAEDQAQPEEAAFEDAAAAEAPEEATLPQAPEEEYEDEGDLAAEEPADGEGDDAAIAADTAASDETAEGDEDKDENAGALSPEDEAELQAELEAVEREVEAHRRADRGGRHTLETTDTGSDDSMNRLMRATEDQMEGAENQRRLATIAHLKAAVAAREADRELGEDGDEKHEDALRSYRDDLARVVRPRRPVAEGSATRRPAAPADRPAPLVLVSEQRIDRPSEGRPAAQPIRPRRIAAGNLAVDESEDENEFEVEGGNVFTDSSSFAEFAERIGATALPDLLEAAAAYSNCVEGREHFTRPEIMRFAAVAGRDMGTEAGEGFSREAGLRSFGMLLREGKIKKIKRGQFAISQSSRFIPEAQKIAR